MNANVFPFGSSHHKKKWQMSEQSDQPVYRVYFSPNRALFLLESAFPFVSSFYFSTQTGACSETGKNTGRKLRQFISQAMQLSDQQNVFGGYRASMRLN